MLFPERRPPLGPDQPWNGDAILAECARLAYLRFESDAAAATALRTALARFGYGDFTPFGGRGRGPGLEPVFDAQAYAATSATRGALIVFRGTQADSFKDFATNARFLPIAWRGAGKVHGGFWGSLAEILPAIERWLTAARPTRLVVTGHSLGAAHATLLAAIRLARPRISPDQSNEAVMELEWRRCCIFRAPVESEWTESPKFRNSGNPGEIWLPL